MAYGIARYKGVGDDSGSGRYRLSEDYNSLPAYIVLSSDTVSIATGNTYVVVAQSTTYSNGTTYNQVTTILRVNGSNVAAGVGSSDSSQIGSSACVWAGYVTSPTTLDLINASGSRAGGGLSLVVKMVSRGSGPVALFGGLGDTGTGYYRFTEDFNGAPGSIVLQSANQIRLAAGVYAVYGNGYQTGLSGGANVYTSLLINYGTVASRQGTGSNSSDGSQLAVWAGRVVDGTILAMTNSAGNRWGAYYTMLVVEKLA